MPTGPCPANIDGELSINGVRVIYHSTWDGTSVRNVGAGCTGPLVSVRAINPANNPTKYAHFRGRRGQPRTLVLTPGFDQTFTQPQLGNNGFTDNTDLEDLVITNSPDNPSLKA